MGKACRIALTDTCLTVHAPGTLAPPLLMVSPTPSSAVHHCPARTCRAWLLCALHTVVLISRRLCHAHARRAHVCQNPPPEGAPPPLAPRRPRGAPQWRCDGPEAGSTQE
eukprot:10395357-Alexandrium_andersonii.AAC.1